MTYTPRLAPRAHQTEALRRITQRPPGADVFALLMEMGTGKTKVVLDEWGQRVEGGDLDSLLVVAPAGSYRNWDRDRPGEPGELSKQLSPALRERIQAAAWVSGGRASDLRSVEKVLLSRGVPRVLVVNVEALSSVEAARDACLRFLQTGRVMMVVDESTRVKNPAAKRTKWVVKMGQLAVARRIMSGLVTPRSPLDLYSQFEFLDPRILGHRSFFTFRMRYAVMQKMWVAGRNIDIVVGYRNVEELQAKIAPWSYRVLKQDCLDLDPKVYQTVDVELSPEQKRIYRELKEFATSSLGGEDHVTATMVITQIMRLHQLLCGHVVDELGVEHDVPERRTDALLEVLEEHGGKAIIWVPYTRALQKVAAAIRRWAGGDPLQVAEYWGGNHATRGEDEYRFKTDPACRWMVATQAAGGIGNNWVAADLVVYFGNNYDLEQRSQSEDRSHRDGQTRSVTYVDLVARGTVDEKIIRSLREKINMASAITGENYRQWLV